MKKILFFYCLGHSAHRIFQFQSAFATDGPGVVTVTSNSGSCVGYTPAQGNGPDNWEVAEGGSYTMTITGVTECADNAITVFIQNSSSGNFCFNATGGSGTYVGSFTMPNPACATSPISYKCGADQPCTNANTINAAGPSGSNSVHLRAANFDGNCIKTSTDENCNATCNISLSGTQTNVMCYGLVNGSIDVSVSGPQGNVTYSWNDGATTEDRSGLSAGTYTLTATDAANCSTSKSFTITEPYVLEMSGVVIDVTIINGSDGSIDLTVTGGTPPYSYLWNDGATTEDRSNLIAGTYSITVTDANGCSSQQTFTVNQPSCYCIISGTQTDVTCYGLSDGSIDVSVSGAQGNVTYSWNDGATTEDRSGLSAGTYTVTVTDGANCSSSKSFTITEPDVLNMSGIVIDVTSINGSDGSIDVTVTGGTPSYSYLWSDGATTEDRSNLTSGTYSITVTDANGCSAQQSFLVNQPSCYCIISGTQTDVTCYGLYDGSIDVSVSGAQGNVTYSWNDGATTEDRSGLSAGTYTVTATDGANCSSSKSFTITEPDVLNVSGVVIDVSSINGSDGSIDVTVTGGTPSYSYLWNDGATTEDRSNLTSGTYSITVTDANGCSAQQSFLVNEPGCICSAPVITSIDSICGNVASMCWTSVPCATEYLVRWLILPHTKWIYTTITAPDTCRQFTNRFGDVNQIQVAAICANGDTSEYSPIVTYTNYLVCAAPLGLVSSNITSTSAKLSWSANPDANNYKVQYKVGANTTTIITKNTSMTLTGLPPSTTVKWMVKSRCKSCGINAWGTYTPFNSFTTASLKELALGQQPASTLVVFPNPANVNFTVNFNIGYPSEQPYTIAILDLAGHVMMTEEGTLANGLLSQEVSLTRGISDGMYFVTITADGKQFRERFMVNKD